MIKCNKRGSVPCDRCKKKFPTPGKPNDLKLPKSICHYFDENTLDIRKSFPGTANQDLQRDTADTPIDFFDRSGRSFPVLAPHGRIDEYELFHPVLMFGSKASLFDNPKLAIELEEGMPNGWRSLVEVQIRVFVNTLMKEELSDTELSVDETWAKINIISNAFFSRKQEVLSRIREGILPSYKHLIDWAHFDIAVESQLWPDDMEYALDSFLLTYTQKRPDLPKVFDRHFQGVSYC